MLRYHHLGLPTDEKKDGMRRLDDLKMWVCGYEESEYKIEWMYFEEECELPELVKSVPHVAFEVESVAEAIQGKHVIIEPTSPSDGLIVAFIEENGAPIEFIETRSY
ncbi:hypothetical protein KS4_29550 [Poriferisphaera corsica]|uniref:VOC domain-containing protein n=2 Tax=Poriferisphaera corsica TaxID=2528020 RepID=A0A517YXD4_9BACT|nr:hypothetical protein KS4_29550 [Poriferisphaera corsica]